MQISSKIQAIAPSRSIRMSAEMEALRRAGKPVIGLHVGEPDFAPHADVLAATNAALQAGQTRYSAVPGLLDLRRKIAEYVRHQNGIAASAENIFMANGSKQVIYNVFQVLLNPGDEVIIPAPYWVTLPESVKLAGGIPVIVPTLTNYQLDLEAIRQAITPRTKALLINSPNNPTGAVYPESTWRTLGDLCLQNQMTLVSDEAYEALTFDVPHFSLASDPRYFDCVLTIQSFSKTFAMTGFRLGHVIGPTAFIRAMDALQGHLTGNVSTFSQYGAMAALDLPESYREENRLLFKHRRDLACELFSELFPGPRPEGAFYLFFDVRPHIERLGLENCEAFTQLLLERAHVALLPGSAFGQSGFARLAFATNEAQLRLAHQRISEVLCK